MKFEYQHIITSRNILDIEDVGNCCLMAENIIHEEYYLVIKTVLGWTEIIKYGPIMLDLKQLPPNVSYSYTRLEYNERKITTQIEKFLNPTNTEIMLAQECDFIYIKNNIRNLIDMMQE